MRKRRKIPTPLPPEPAKRKRGRPRKHPPEPGLRSEWWWGIISPTTGRLLRVYELQAEAMNINSKVFMEKVVPVQVSYRL